MNSNYDIFAETFSQSRRNMRWEEIEYFFSFIESHESILDVWCGSGRLLSQYFEYFDKLPDNYLWIDASKSLLKEAKKNFSNQNFMYGNMKNLETLCGHKQFHNIFFIASFHHLENLEERILVLTQAHKLLCPGWRIYMTNWNLQGKYNIEKYKDSCISKSENIYGSRDYLVKIGKSQRFYHSFSLSELKYISEKSWCMLIENKEFAIGKNILTIFQK